MIQPSFSDLEKLASRPARVAVYREILADMETPVSAYLKVANGPSFLLESVEGGEHLGRYSFIGPSPSAQLRIHASGTADLKQGEVVTQLAFQDPLALIDRIVAGEEYVPSDGLPRFAGGAVGYLS